MFGYFCGDEAPAVTEGDNPFKDCRRLFSELSIEKRNLQIERGKLRPNTENIKELERLIEKLVSQIAGHSPDVQLEALNAVVDQGGFPNEE